MSAINSVTVGLFPNHQDAEDAVRALQKSGYDMKKLSVIGKDYHTEENVIGYYNTGDRAATWGKFGLFWGFIWGLLLGSGFFILPGVGPVMVGGPLVSWMIGALEAAAFTGGFSALGGALSGIGIPRDSVLLYETALKANKFILVVHGTRQEAAHAKDILTGARAEETALHDLKPDDAVTPPAKARAPAPAACRYTLPVGSRRLLPASFAQIYGHAYCLQFRR